MNYKDTLKLRQNILLWAINTVIALFVLGVLIFAMGLSGVINEL